MMDIPTDLKSYTRVLKKAEIPDWNEFWKTATIAAAGVGIIGAIGFVIFILMSFIMPA